MKKNLLNKIIEKKNSRSEFALVTNLENGESFVFENNLKIPKNFYKYKKQINIFFKKKENGIIKNTGWYA